MSVTATITSNGHRLDVGVAIVSIMVTKEVNRIPTAEIRVRDGSGAEQEFTISSSTFFEPGSDVEILLRYNTEEDHLIFKGVVVSQSVEADRRSSSLTARLKDRAVAMTQTRRSRVFRDQTDSDAIKTIIDEAGLSAGSIPTTDGQHEEIVQYYSTDWDFVVSRADVNGLLTVADSGEIDMAPIAIGSTPKHEFSFGMSTIYDFELQLDGADQSESYASVGWDLTEQRLTEPATAADFELPQGDLSAGDVAKKLGFGPFTLSHPVATSGPELEAWSSSRLARSRMAFIRGRLGVPGVGDLSLLDVISIDGIGSRFDGTTIVTGLVHRLSDEGWTTDVQFGLTPKTFAETVRTDDVAAAGLLPPISGLQVGVIGEFEDDPAGEQRVRVTVPGIDASEGRLWARIATFDAGAERGWFARPEIGDEVVLGFFDNDPRQPVIIGSLHGSVNAPPTDLGPATEDNHLKGIVTRGGTRLIFDDEKPAVSIETVAGNKLAIDDDAGTITILDRNDNTITLSDDGIVVSAAGDLNIEAGGDLAIAGSGAVTIQAGGDLLCKADGNVEIEGTKVDVK